MMIIKNIFVTLFLMIFIGGFFGGCAYINFSKIENYPHVVKEYTIGFPVFGAIIGLIIGVVMRKRK